MTPAPDSDDFSTVEVPLWPWHYHHFNPPGHPDHFDMFHCHLNKPCQSCRRFNYDPSTTTTTTATTDIPPSSYPEFFNHHHQDYYYTRQQYWEEPADSRTSMQVLQRTEECSSLMFNYGSNHNNQPSCSRHHEIHHYQSPSLISEIESSSSLSHQLPPMMMMMNECKVFPNSSCYICSSDTDDILMYCNIYDTPAQETILILAQEQQQQQQQRQVMTTTTSSLDKEGIMNIPNYNDGMFHHHSNCSNSMTTSYNYTNVHDTSAAAPSMITTNPHFCSQLYQHDDYYNNNCSFQMWRNDVYNNYYNGFNNNHNNFNFDEYPARESNNNNINNNNNANFYKIKPPPPPPPPCSSSLQTQQKQPQKHKQWKKASTLPKHKRVSSISSSCQQFPNNINNTTTNYYHNQQSFVQTSSGSGGSSSGGTGGDKIFWQKLGPSSSGTLELAEGSNRIVQTKFNNPNYNPPAESATSTNFQVVGVAEAAAAAAVVGGEKSINFSTSLLSPPPPTLSSSPKYQNFQTLQVEAADVISSSSSANQKFPVENVPNIPEQQKYPTSTEEVVIVGANHNNWILEEEHNVADDEHHHHHQHEGDDAEGISSDSTFLEVPDDVVSNIPGTTPNSTKEEFIEPHLKLPVEDTKILVMPSAPEQSTFPETKTQSLLEELKTNNNNRIQISPTPAAVASTEPIAANLSKKTSIGPTPVKIGRCKLDKRQDEPKKVCKAKQRPFLLKDKLTEKFEEVRHETHNLTKRPASIDFQAKVATITCPKQRCKDSGDNGGRGGRGGEEKNDCCCNQDNYLYSTDTYSDHEATIAESTFMSMSTTNISSSSSAATTFVSFKGRKKPGENTEIYLAALIPIILDHHQEGTMRRVRRSQAGDTRQVGIQTEL